MSLATSVPSSTATRQGGMLLSLPRELRDMIYRHVVKRTYVLYSQPRLIWIGNRQSYLSPNLGILRVSKTISGEAIAVLYAESTFRIYLHFEQDQARQLSSIPALERMMNIELDVKVDPRTVECLGSMRQIWIATLGCISCTNNIRKSLHVRWRRTFSELSIWSDFDVVTPEWMFRKLKSMTRFRTIVLQNFAHNIDTSDRNLKSLFNKSEATAIINHLTRALGPADSVSSPGHPQCAVSLTFHPQRHMPALLKARAADLRAKADELDLEAKRAEEGI